MSDVPRAEAAVTAVTAPEPERLSWSERWSDRLNPILMREVTQTLRSRVFLVTLMASVGAIVILAISGVIGFRGSQSQMGREAFSICLMCLSPIVLFIVPMQAFSSMRQEVSGGTAEQLLLSRLSPWRIVLGKLAASMVQFVMFLAVFAPLLAFTFLLRGVDVPTIALMLWFAAMSCITTTAVAIAGAALARYRVLEVVMRLVVTAALFGATIMGIAGAFELPRGIAQLMRSDEFWSVLSGLTGACILAVVLTGMLASAALSHSYENRSTQFRLFAFAAALLMFGWAALVIPRGSLGDVGPVIATMVALVLAPIWLFACCEARELSPRVRTRIPKSRLLAQAAVPVLPGGGRGLLFTIQLGVLAIGCGFALPMVFGVSPRDRLVGVMLMAWGYVMIYAAVARWVRCALKRGTQQSLTALAITLAIMLVGVMLPLLIAVMSGHQTAFEWDPTHLLNPFFTIAHNDRWGSAVPVVIGLASVSALLLFRFVPQIIADAREVADASAARRAAAKSTSES